MTFSTATPAHPGDPVEADVDTGYQISAATNLNDPTTMSEKR